MELGPPQQKKMAMSETGPPPTPKKYGKVPNWSSPNTEKNMAKSETGPPPTMFFFWQSQILVLPQH